MPVLGIEDPGPGGQGRLDLGIDDRDDLRPARDRQSALGVGKVVLDIDDDERGGGVVVGHRPMVARCPDGLDRDGPGGGPECSSIERHVKRPLPRAQPTTHSTNDAQTWTMFLTLAVIWGSSFMWIRIGLDEGVAPMAIVSMRTFFAALLLAAVLVVRGGRLPLRWNLWKRMFFLGATNIVVPFALIAWGQQYIPSGMASILNAMVPLFTIVFAALALADEHITAAKLGGLGIGFLGVIVLALPSLRGRQRGPGRSPGRAGHAGGGWGLPVLRDRLRLHPATSHGYAHHRAA